MTQSNETVQQAAPQASNVPFNLIITPNRAQAQRIAKHFALSDMRFVDDMHLPPGGAKRGDALNELLAKNEHTLTLVVLADDPWLNTLLNNTPVMASGVWRAIESKLLGHRTGSQRNLLIVGNSFSSGVREAEDNNDLLAVCAGAPLPHNWKPALAPKAPVPKKKAAKPAVGRAPARFLDPAVTKEPVTLGEVPNFGKKAAKPLDRSKKAKTRPAGSNNAMYDDLYLLSKGRYGTATGDLFIAKARAVVTHHTGIAGPAVQNDVLVSHLFRTLIGKAARGYWGGFNLLQEMTNAAGHGPTEVIGVLNSWIANIPARDVQGKEIPQPKVNPALTTKFAVERMTNVLDIKCQDGSLESAAA